MARTKRDVEATEEVVDLKRAAKIEKRAEKKIALIAILEYVKENSGVDLLLGYVKLLTPGNRGGGVRVSSSKTAIVEMIVENGSVTEDAIWNEFKLGRAEMRKISVNLIKKVSKPEDRMWISFDPEDGVYTLIEIGADVPEGWTGYRPVDTEDIDL